MFVAPPPHIERRHVKCPNKETPNIKFKAFISLNSLMNYEDKKALSTLIQQYY
jgi:hypothetical protein